MLPTFFSDILETAKILYFYRMGAFAGRKRESGGNPERSRHCNRGAFLFEGSHWVVLPGKAKESGEPEARKPARPDVPLTLASRGRAKLYV